MNEGFNQRMKKKLEFHKRRILGVPEPSPLLPLPQLLEGLLSLGELEWGWYAFARDPIGGRFSPQQKRELIQKASDCGREYARRCLQEFPGCTPAQLASRLGLKVLYPQRPLEKSAAGGRVLFALFTSPDQIEIFTDCTAKAGEAIRREHLEEMLQGVEVQDVLLAHEIFHYLEQRDADTIFTETYRFDLRPFGILHNRSRVVCLGEIAAMGFAKELLGLSYCPYLFDVFLVYFYQQQVACNLYAQIKKLSAGAAEPAALPAP